MSSDTDPVVACPTCNGPLSSEAKEWVCEVGHRFTFDQLDSEQAAAVVRTLWYALRALEDRAISSKFAAAEYDKDGLDQHADRLRTQQVEDLAMVDQLHTLLQEVESSDGSPDAGPAGVSHEEPPDQGSHE